MLKFKINNMKWTAKVVDKDSEKLQYDGTQRFGMCHYTENTIYIADNLKGERRLRTIIHEVTHAFIESNGMYSFEEFNHEQLCEFLSCHGKEILLISNKINDGKER